MTDPLECLARVLIHVLRWDALRGSPATSHSFDVVDALLAALTKIHAEGLAARYRRHDRASAFFRNAMSELGLEMAADTKASSPSVTAVETGGRFEPAALVRFLEKEHGLRIATGVGELQDAVFRVGHMGDNAREEALQPLVDGIAEFLAR